LEKTKITRPMLEIEAATHLYGPVKALNDVSLVAGEGEFLTILGESGSGKTTLLRMISGLEHPTEIKKLEIGGENVIGVPPAKRNCTTVFQNYALFPHMSVAENIAYGLLVRGIPREDARRAASKALDTVRLSGFEARSVSQLSGGQKQRVAIAGAMVTQLAILLLDEPLGALDERLRLDMQTELVDLQRQLGTTFIYITHSQEEALAMSDRIVLMRSGRIEQLGTPSDLFDRPTSVFSAKFMGFENLMSGTVKGSENGRTKVELAGGTVIAGVALSEETSAPGSRVQVALRAERVSPFDASKKVDASINVIKGRRIDQRYRGKYSDILVETSAGALKIRSWDVSSLPADFDSVSWRADDCIILPTVD
jgi:spermidine/putrescine transport system ATP-binding protein